MANSISEAFRPRRLNDLARAWGIGPAVPQPFPTRPPNAGTRFSEHDEFLAEQLLRTRREAAAPERQGNTSSLRRAFGTHRGKGWTAGEVYAALGAHVDECGSAGVAAALVTKLFSAGGNTNTNSVASGSRPSFLSRRSSTAPSQRNHLLQRAIEHGSAPLVAVLAPHADIIDLNACLPLAIRSARTELVEILLSCGARTADTADGLSAFNEICAAGGHRDLLALLVSADGCPGILELSLAMLNATQRGDSETVLLLSRYADGSYANAAALRDAVQKSRADLLLAILTGTRPPDNNSINAAFNLVFSHPTISPPNRIDMAEILLCAGANGDIVALSLADACRNDFNEMVSLLLCYGASVEYDHALVLRQTIIDRKLNLCTLLLSDEVVLRPGLASECVAHLPKDLTHHERLHILSLLLGKGAYGDTLSDCLIDATMAGDIDSVALLLTPVFPADTAEGPAEQQEADAEGQAALTHHMASVDFKDGTALQHAVQSANLAITCALLGAEPSSEVLANVFPHIYGLPTDSRRQMMELFLATGFHGPVVTTTLERVIQELPQDRDPQLIPLLLKSHADINANGGAGLISVVENGDITLLEVLLQNSEPSTGVLADALSRATALSNPSTRRKVVAALLSAGAVEEKSAVAEALVAVILVQPVDEELIDTLLNQGNADINYDAGAAVVLATSFASESILVQLLQTHRASQETLCNSLISLSTAPSDSVKVAKLSAILKYSPQIEPLNAFLVTEMQIVVETPPPQRSLSVVQALLSAGVDVNAHAAEALGDAIAVPILEAVDMFLQKHPTPLSMKTVFFRIFKISDTVDRLSMAERLLEYEVPADEVARALDHAVVNFPRDVSLLMLLAASSDPDDTRAVISAVTSQDPTVLSILLTSERLSGSVLNAGLTATMKLSDKPIRQEISTQLLMAGASGRAVSSAFTIAAIEADLRLASILLEYSADCNYKDGRAFLQACRTGASKTLQLVFRSKFAVRDDLLRLGLQEAASIENLDIRESIFSMLLEQGVTSTPVDEQLIKASRMGSDGQSIVRLLLKYGASVNYKAGSALTTCVHTGCISTMRLLLGIDDGLTATREEYVQPSQDTMALAISAATTLDKRVRYQMCELLFTAGLQPTDAVHAALNHAVKEDQVDMSLIGLLLNNGADPQAEGYETLMDATRRCRTDILRACIAKVPVSSANLNALIKAFFVEDHTEAWLSPDGLATAKCLFEAGAKSTELGHVLLSCVGFCSDPEVQDLAKSFVDLLIETGSADVDFKRGLPLQAAINLGDATTLRKLLLIKPNAESTNLAFSCIFESAVSEDVALMLINLFGEHETYNPDGSLDAAFKHPHREAVMYLALSGHPRSTLIVQAVLDLGYVLVPSTSMCVGPDPSKKEPVPVLFWALSQPEQKISDAVIKLLVDCGCEVNFETSESATTCLMLAVQTKRPDVVKALIQAGAKTDVSDSAEHTPLIMAVLAGGKTGLAMMSDILRVSGTIDDGALHMAARNLDLEAMELLVAHGHSVDLPSPLHDGRSALAELCLHGSDGGPLARSRKKDLEHCISFLIRQGSDIRLNQNGKPLLLLALEAAGDPAATTQALLKAGVYKHVNNPSNQFHDGCLTYSPTMYVKLVLQPPAEVRDGLLKALYMNRAIDVYYAETGPQPPGYANVPKEFMKAERKRMALRDRVAAEEQEHQRVRRHAEEMARLAAKAKQAELDLLVKRADAEVSAAQRLVQAKADAEVKASRISAEAEAIARRLVKRQRDAERDAEMQHLQERDNVERRLEDAKYQRLLKQEQTLHAKRMTMAKEVNTLGSQNGNYGYDG